MSEQRLIIAVDPAKVGADKTGYSLVKLTANGAELLRYMTREEFEAEYPREYHYKNEAHFIEFYEFYAPNKFEAVYGVSQMEKPKKRPTLSPIATMAAALRRSWLTGLAVLNWRNQTHTRWLKSLCHI